MAKVTIEGDQLHLRMEGENIAGSMRVPFDHGLGRALVEAGWSQPEKCHFADCDKPATRFNDKVDVCFCGSHHRKASEVYDLAFTLRKYKPFNEGK